jgi:hypothetical protein
LRGGRHQAAGDRPRPLIRLGEAAIRVAGA